MQKTTNSLSYDDVLLVPKYSNIESRKEIDIGSSLDKQIHLEVPIIASPMDTVTNSNLSSTMANLGAMAIMHRYNTPADQITQVMKVRDSNPRANIGIAVGVSDDYRMRVKLAKQAGVRLICFDVAHGHHVLVERAIKATRDEHGDLFHIMAGNVATVEGLNDLADWGANSIRVGIGGGSICSTRIQTGHGVPTFQSVLDCSQTDRDVKIIADGGAKTSGDIVKALAAGADFVMLGSLLAGTTEAPGELIYDKSGQSFKTYRGMASSEAQIEWRGATASVEGIATVIPTKGPLRDTVESLSLGIRSGFSYSGARNLAELQAKAKFVKQTVAGQSESATHILARWPNARRA